MKVGEIKKKSVLAVVGYSLTAITGCTANPHSSAPQDPPTAAVPVAPPTSNGKVAISPVYAYVQVNQTIQFTLSDVPTNTVIHWSVSGDCVGTACGTIDSTGKYLAPMTPTEGPGLKIQAVAYDPAFEVSTYVFITPPPTHVAVSPAVVTIPAGGKQTFAATGDPWNAVPVVSWAVSGSNCQAATCGTIDAQGNYQAPENIPNPYSIRVTATSVADASISASADVTLGNNPNSAKLNGQYAFVVGGYDGDGSVFMAGTFVADGNGNITSGREDLDFSSAISVDSNTAIAGIYSVSSDNRATLNLVTQPSSYTHTFSVALTSFSADVANRGKIIELDGNAVRTTGILAKQDPSAFSTNALSGGYAFGFAGNSPTGWPMEVTGRFTATGGSISNGQTDIYGLGLSEGGSGQVTSVTNLPFTGAYQVSADGRGTAALSFDDSPGFSNFTFYVISARELLFLETDNPCLPDEECRFKGGMFGTALQQSGGPFMSQSLNGNAVFQLSGNDTPAGQSVGKVAVGWETFDGKGGVTGTEFKNDVGQVTLDAPFEGQVSVDPNGLGRGVITILGDSQPIYLVSPGKAFIMDSNSYDSGFIEPQTNTAFEEASLYGDYVFGTLPLNFDWAFDPACGVLTADGKGGLFGVSDGYAGTDQAFAGSYRFGQNGETAVTFNPQGGSPSNWVFFLVSPSKAVGIDVDPGSANTAITIIEH